MKSEERGMQSYDEMVELEEILSAYTSRGSWPPVAITHSIAVDLLGHVAEPEFDGGALSPRDVSLGTSGQGQVQRPTGCQAVAKFVGDLLGGDERRSQLPATARPILAVLDDVVEGVLPPEPDRLRIALAQHLGPPASHMEVASVVREVGYESLCGCESMALGVLIDEGRANVDDDPILPLAADPELPLATQTELPTLVPRPLDHKCEEPVGLHNQQLPELLEALGAEGDPTGKIKGLEMQEDPYVGIPERPQVLRRVQPSPVDGAKLSHLPRFGGPDQCEPIISALPQNSGVWEQAPSRRRAKEASERSRHISSRMGIDPHTESLRGSFLAAGVHLSKEKSSMLRQDSINDPPVLPSSSSPTGHLGDAGESPETIPSPGSSERANEPPLVPVGEGQPRELSPSMVSVKDGADEGETSSLAEAVEPEEGASSGTFTDKLLVIAADLDRSESFPTLEVSARDPSSGVKTEETSPSLLPAQAERSSKSSDKSSSSTSRNTLRTIKPSVNKHARGKRPVVRHEYCRTDRPVSVAVAPAARRTARAIRDGDSLLGPNERPGWTVWAMIVGIVGLAAYLVLS